ncbi:hypothetical protein [Streptomyces atratus]|uniref:hypothetical protein n=1 Tax=Streptomyces atratus TaxID=1893 RepID=UPI003F69B58E
MLRSAGLTVSAHSTGEPAHLTPGIELSAFRIIQEALSNAMWHAPGAEVRVEADHRPSAGTFRIADTAPTSPRRASATVCSAYGSALRCCVSCWLSAPPPTEDTK